MFFLLIGIAGLLLKFLEIAPVAAWSWPVVLVGRQIRLHQKESHGKNGQAQGGPN